MDNSRLKENIRILEQGITLQKFAEIQNQLLIEGSMAVYNEYGMYVVHNVTQNVYLIDGGNSPRAFSMSTSIMQFFLTNNGCGNPYMHQHYVKGDEMILKFYQYDKTKYQDIDEMELSLTAYYDRIAENYFDYILRMNGHPIRKGERRPGYNRYYNGGQPKPIVNDSLASKLLLLESKHKYLYEFLNAIFDCLLKAIPIFIYMFVTMNDDIIGTNVIQNFIYTSISVFAMYLVAIISYLFILVIIQVIKLCLCTYKGLVIHVRIFDILIKLGEKKLFTSEDYDLLEEHKCNIVARKEKIYNRRKKAYEKKKVRQEEELKYRKSELQYNKEKAEDYRYSAKAEYESARRGDGLFATAEEKRKRAAKDIDNAKWYKEQAAREEERISELERKLGK